jgi:plasmid stabilization system protein ParE
LTDRALSDISEIERYSLAEWGRKTARKYVDIAVALDRLSEEPGLLRQEPEFAKGLCFYRVRKQILACDYRGTRIVVLTVTHTSMDLTVRLAELVPSLAAEVEFLHRKLQECSDPERSVPRHDLPAFLVPGVVAS